MRKPFIYAADTAELRVTAVNHSVPKVHTCRGSRTKERSFMRLFNQLNNLLWDRNRTDAT